MKETIWFLGGMLAGAAILFVVVFTWVDYPTPDTQYRINLDGISFDKTYRYDGKNYKLVSKDISGYYDTLELKFNH